MPPILIAHPEEHEITISAMAVPAPDHQSGMAKFTPGQQQIFVQENPAAFTPENGAWGLQVCTRDLLHSVDEDKLWEALTLAWQNIVNKGTAGRSTRKGAIRAIRSSRRP